ncbi:sigma-70 family RNA polymerase sigma factor [Comamonas odontotermitis]|uniref:sigma-70 family RNA polymerase sigma factor n=1 Tax=Comamonas odontotermitis TaxID=379895 RepID=UPI001CC7EE89|nr:sigma-70 family RNA polymerase sigma factor [Comamonas odontotermitis]UBB15915.1 sigma-70 family RNA polymerase sigma factor [Comamonas odontotermitis]
MVDEQQPDEALMLAYARGHAAAFEPLYARHSQRLWRYFFRNTGNAALADDLAQDTWFAVVDAAPGYEPSAKFSTWAFTLAHHKLVDHWRRHKPHASLDEETSEGMALAETLFANSGFDPERLQGRKDIARALLHALSQLPPEQREAFLLQAEADMAVADIAAATRVTQETAKSRLRYARAKLRQALSAGDEEPQKVPA